MSCCTKSGLNATWSLQGHVPARDSQVLPDKIARKSPKLGTLAQKFTIYFCLSMISLFKLGFILIALIYFLVFYLNVLTFPGKVRPRMLKRLIGHEVQRYFNVCMIALSGQVFTARLILRE